jgi:hypothetical protein
MNCALEPVREIGPLEWKKPTRGGLFVLRLSLGGAFANVSQG